MPETQKEPAKKSYSDTVHLPKTDFPMKGDLPKREPGWLAMWEEKGVYQRMLGKAEGRPAFVLHDGPPYANGHTHIGHALNKILKDMTVKSQALMGKRAPYVPGWDCHGLPIEHALLKEKKMSKRGVKDVNEFRAEARAFAQRFIDIQRDEFRRMGVLGDWTRPYTTMSKEYEAAIVGAFRRLYAEGYIYRGLKAVTWCVTCETALAEAEVEYKDKTSPSVYVALPVKSFDHEAVMAQNDMRLMDVLQNAGAAVLVWTTTPWTLPANMAVAFNPAFTYALVRAKGPFGERVLFVAEARL
ncbi:MAG TPA: class I tRNA ligase family protein, partial [Elusimicrobiota bacterium]|nr:class I tRNA ligase family protein [Elusimicrobiota bacterium]